MFLSFRCPAGTWKETGKGKREGDDSKAFGKYVQCTVHSNLSCFVSPPLGEERIQDARAETLRLGARYIEIKYVMYIIRLLLSFVLCLPRREKNIVGELMHIEEAVMAGLKREKSVFFSL